MEQEDLINLPVEQEASSEFSGLETEQMLARRELLKLATGGIVTAAIILPDKWLRPVTEVGRLPVHAQISQLPTATSRPTATPTNAPTSTLTPTTTPTPTAPPIYQYTLVVPGTANIWGAGHAVPPAPGGGGAGTLPPYINLPSGTGRVATFSSVTGIVNFGNGEPSADSAPDGTDDVLPGAVNINSVGGISGIIFNGRGQFLTGVTLDLTEPVDPPPATGDFTGADGWPDFNVVLRQLFFIGNGRMGRDDPAGTMQSFHIPDTATRLYLGLPDAYYHMGDPGQYTGNSGSFTASFTITTS
ncbi:hypothetical protein TFLX_02734 [Thermoflexales bacterium]|nr:hypothetical protein TFLX_02734 [Thermoflexales bacterium]